MRPPLFLSNRTDHGSRAPCAAGAVTLGRRETERQQAPPGPAANAPAVRAASCALRPLCPLPCLHPGPLLGQAPPSRTLPSGAWRWNGSRTCSSPPRCAALQAMPPSPFVARRGARALVEAGVGMRPGPGANSRLMRTGPLALPRPPRAARPLTRCRRAWARATGPLACCTASACSRPAGAASGRPPGPLPRAGLRPALRRSGGARWRPR
jgi:hypothetical protein